MATNTLLIHGDPVTINKNVPITIDVTTTFTGWSGSTPLYTVYISLNKLASGYYFGYNLYITLNNETKQLKGNSPATWNSGAKTLTFTNVPVNSLMTVSSTNCGCGSWYPSPQVPYDAVAPGVPGEQKVNGAYTVSVLERTDSLKLTWTRPNAGTYGISGYRIYYSVGAGWQLIAEVGSTTLSYTTSIAKIYNKLGRGGSLGFQITAFNAYAESVRKPGVFDNNTVTLKAMKILLNSSNITPIQAKIGWSSNINVSTVRYKLSTESSWRTVSTGLTAKSGHFNATGLAYNRSQTVQVQLTAKSDGTVVTASTIFKTLDIAHITKLATSWSIDDPLTFTISNPANCTLQLYLSYNNVEVISRNNITLTNGQYTLTLTNDEKNLLYSFSASDKSPSFTFILKSYISGTKVGEDSKSISLTFPTKAWVKISSTWKRAIVWAKPGSTWKQVTPWVDPTNNKKWKRI